MNSSARRSKPDYMGGNLFKLGRKSHAEYLLIEGQVRDFLDPLLGDGCRIPRYRAANPGGGL